MKLVQQPKIYDESTFGPYTYEQLSRAYQGLGDYAQAKASREKGLTKVLERHPDKHTSLFTSLIADCWTLQKLRRTWDDVVKYGKATIESAVVYGTNQSWRSNDAKTLATFLEAHNRKADADEIAKLAR